MQSFSIARIESKAAVGLRKTAKSRKVGPKFGQENIIVSRCCTFRRFDNLSLELSSLHRKQALGMRKFSKHQLAKNSGMGFQSTTPHASSSQERETKTPHSGFHFDGTSRRFFEGWYFKISIPEVQQSFAWMYAVEDPGANQRSPFGLLENILSPEKKFPGIVAQVLGADGEYLWQQEDGTTNGFWGSKHELELGYTFKPNKNVRSGPKGMVSKEKFSADVLEGFQVSPTFHQGCLRDNGRSPELTAVETVQWEYTTRPVYGWGPVGGVQLATAGWLAAFPVFEPHWQVCMAGGLSSGWVQWGGTRYEFENAPSYAEKNWGGSFPDKWFWVQCNVFERVEGEMALTAGGGKRGLPFLPNASEETAMVGVHYRGKFYEFVPWAGEVRWEIDIWGRWYMEATSDDYEVELLATTNDRGTILRAPSKDAGFSPMCKDTFFGELEISIWERRKDGSRGANVVTTRSSMPALEVGGGPWWGTWKNSATVVPPLSGIFGLPVDVGNLVPEPLQPPGL